ncbi:MAG: OmpA family protein, partial [Methylocystis sp.]
ALALEALQGPAALSLTSALLFYGVFLSGATLGALIKFGNLSAHESWAVGLAPLMVIWLIAANWALPNYSVLPNTENRTSSAAQTNPMTNQSGASENTPSALAVPADREETQGRTCQQRIQAEVELKNIVFHKQSVRINRHMRPLLDKVAGVIRRCANTVIKVYAYADSLTSIEINRLLAERRTQAVIDYLIRAGVPATNFETNDYKNINFPDLYDQSAKSRAVHISAQ